MKVFGFCAVVFCAMPAAGCGGGHAMPAVSSAAGASNLAAPAASAKGPFLYAAGETLSQYALGSSKPLHSVSPKYGNQFSAVTVDHSGRLIVVDGLDAVSIYDARTLTLLKTIDATYPQSVAVDRNDNIYIANCGAGVGVFSPGGKKELREIGSQFGACLLAADHRGNIYVVNGYHRIEAYAPFTGSGSHKLLRTITRGLNGPSAIAFDASDDMYVANYPGTGHNGNAVVYPRDSLKPSLRIYRGILLPLAIAADANGTVYVANDPQSWHGHDGWVSVYAAGSDKIERHVRTGVNAPLALTLDSAGNLYTGNAYGGEVSVHSPGGERLLRKIHNGGVTNTGSIVIGD